MTFTKRGEKQSIGRPTEVKHKEIYADVEYKVIASQGPAEPAVRTGWINEIRENYKSLGFSEKLYYRHIRGALLSGDVHQALASAADLLMCQKELIFLEKEPKRWHSNINREIADQMIALLDKDHLWERGQ